MGPTSPAHNLGPLVRMVYWDTTQLPAHSALPSSLTGSTPRPDLATFVTALLEEGASFLSPTTFETNFKRAGDSSQPPSDSPSQVWKCDISKSDLASLDYTSAPVPCPNPSPDDLSTEHWFARRSIHANISSKQSKGSANWSEFIYGLRDEHSKHEMDFTPDLFDAHHILDWNAEVRQLEKDGKLGKYTAVTTSIYEMAHSIPPPLSPRCFSVLVVTASTSPTSFMQVTIPVDLSKPAMLDLSFYTSGRNTTDPSASSQQKKKPVFGIYCAVETVRILDGKSTRDPEAKIEWTMATASDAAGNLPMFMQELSMPSAVPKDVSYFMEWIAGVPEDEIGRQEVGTH